MLLAHHLPYNTLCFPYSNNPFMKQLNLSRTSPNVTNPTQKSSLWISIPVGVILCTFLFGFTYSSIAEQGSIFPFFNSDSYNAGTISMSVNSSSLKGAKVQEAFLTSMEQYEGVYSNILNISLEDIHGNKGAISITDLRDQKGGLTLGKYYGVEHDNSSLNYYVDLGPMSFSNNSILILEGKNGDSIISRNGWINITSCKNGKLSGHFEFQIGTSNATISKGYFEDVILKVEK